MINIIMLYALTLHSGMAQSPDWCSTKKLNSVHA